MSYDYGSYLGSAEHERDKILDAAKQRRIDAAKAAGTYVPERVNLQLSAREAQKLLGELAGRRGHLKVIRGKLLEAYANAR